MGCERARTSATYTVGDALDDWLANGLSGRSDRTKELYRDTVKPLRDRLGEVKLRELTAGDLQETLDVLAARLSTGLRTEELRALRWNEVDLDAGTVAVYRAVRARRRPTDPRPRLYAYRRQMLVGRWSFGVSWYGPAPRASMRTWCDCSVRKECLSCSSHSSQRPPH
jgi:integrase